MYLVFIIFILTIVRHTKLTKNHGALTYFNGEKLN